MLKCDVRSKDQFVIQFFSFPYHSTVISISICPFQVEAQLQWQKLHDRGTHGGLRKFLYIAFPKVNTQCNKNNARRKANVPFSKRVKWQWQNLLSFSAPQLTQPAVRWSIDGYMPYAKYIHECCTPYFPTFPRRVSVSEMPGVKRLFAPQCNNGRCLIRRQLTQIALLKPFWHVGNSRIFLRKLQQPGSHWK